MLRRTRDGRIGRRCAAAGAPRPAVGLDPVVARAQGLGGFDVNIRPRTAEVWVDGRFIGLAHDLDGYPSYLWLEEGDHTVAVSKGGFETWEQDVSVSAGVVNEMKLELRPGVAEAPREDERDRE